MEGTVGSEPGQQWVDYKLQQSIVSALMCTERTDCMHHRYELATEEGQNQTRLPESVSKRKKDSSFAAIFLVHGGRGSHSQVGTFYSCP